MDFYIRNIAHLVIKCKLFNGRDESLVARSIEKILGNKKDKQAIFVDIERKFSHKRGYRRGAPVNIHCVFDRPLCAYFGASFRQVFRK